MKVQAVAVAPPLHLLRAQMKIVIATHPLVAPHKATSSKLTGLPMEAEVARAILRITMRREDPLKWW